MLHENLTFDTLFCRYQVCISEASSNSRYSMFNIYWVRGSSKQTYLHLQHSVYNVRMCQKHWHWYDWLCMINLHKPEVCILSWGVLLVTALWGVRCAAAAAQWWTSTNLNITGPQSRWGGPLARRLGHWRASAEATLWFTEFTAFTLSLVYCVYTVVYWACSGVYWSCFIVYWVTL